MDKNTIIGFLLILGIIVGFGWLNQPSKEVAEARRRYNDSIAAIAQAQQAAIITADTQKQENDTTTIAVADISKYGYFESVAKGTDERIVIENELIKLTFATKGGGIYSA
ncbi:MAG: membrane protein insertase YidC, partial [Brevinema sp.]